MSSCSYPYSAPFCYLPGASPSPPNLLPPRRRNGRYSLRLKASKLPPRALPQAFQRGANLPDFRLGFDSSLGLRAAVQLRVDFVLDLAGARGGILTQGLGGEFDVEGCLHEFGESVEVGMARNGARAGVESGEEGTAEVFEEGGEDGNGEVWGCGGNLGVG